MTDELGLKTVAMIVATIALLGIGQVLFKYAATSIDFGDPRSFLSFPLAAALLVYGVATVAWLAVLARVPLSIAFPFYGLAFLLVPLLSVLILGERFRWSTVIGGMVIILGIIISSRQP